MRQYLLGVGEPGRLLGPISAAWGLKELVLTVGMALLTRRPQVAMLMFICGARRKVFPEDKQEKKLIELRTEFGQCVVCEENILLRLW